MVCIIKICFEKSHIPSKEGSHKGKEKESAMQIGMLTWMYSVF